MRDQDGVDNWGEVTKLTASDAMGLDFFAISVSVSGNTTMVGLTITIMLVSRQARRISLCVMMVVLITGDRCPSSPPVTLR